MSTASDTGPLAVGGREQAARATTGWYALALGMLFVLALGTRVIGLGGAVTEDEDQWIARSGTFARALATGDWRRTYLTGHPGVTTMWLTTLTLGIERTLPFERGSGAPDVTTVPDFLPALERARVPFAVLQAGLVVVVAALTGRLLGHATGLIAGLLMAAEPFWAGVGPVVGMDGLLTGFLAVSLLALLLACGLGTGPAARPRRRIGWAALAGATFGLASLTKTTALLAGPVIPVLALVAGWLARRQRAASHLTKGQEVTDRPTANQSAAGTAAAERPAVDQAAAGQTATADRRPGMAWWWTVPLVVGAGWAGAAALVIWLVWPAAWASPLGTLERAFSFSARLGGTAHGPGNFLLGVPVADPGLLFYPVALVVRLGPGLLVGLLLLFLFGAPSGPQRVVWPLLGYAVLFMGLLMAAPKKVDRYLLPLLPALAVLAAVGWMEAAARIRNIARHRALPPSASRSIIPLVALLAFGLQVWPLVQAGRYPLAAYNPLVGGAQTAEQAIPVGWGDGLDVAAERIREMAGGRTVVTSIWSPLRVSFGAHAPGPVVSERQIAQADFYVDYVHARQRRTTPRQLVNRAPDAVVSIGGVDYARIYRLR